jgi:hypothetical protein
VFMPHRQSVQQNISATYTQARLGVCAWSAALRVPPNRRDADLSSAADIARTARRVAPSYACRGRVQRGAVISGAVLDHQTHMKGGVAGGGRITPAALEGNLLHRVPDVGGLLAEVRLRADVPGEGALRPSTVTPNGW